MPRRWPPTEDPEYRLAMDHVLERGLLTEGPEVSALEEEFAAFLDPQDPPYVVAVSSGTAALTGLLAAYRVRETNSVVCPALSFTASALAPASLGAEVIFADVDRAWGLDPAAAAEKIRGDTGAMVVTHLHGNPAAMSELRRAAYQTATAVIEDCCAAAGAAVSPGRPVGLEGDGAAFSFNAGKMLAAGEGGLAVTRSEEVAERVRALAYFGERPYRYGPLRRSAYLGYNWKLPELTAAVARVSLRGLPARVVFSRRNAETLNAAMAGPFRPPESYPDALPAWHKYRVPLEDGTDRSVAEAALKRNGVPYAETDVLPLPKHPAFPGDGHGFPEAERALVRAVVIGTPERPIFDWTPPEAERYADGLRAAGEELS